MGTIDEMVLQVLDLQMLFSGVVISISGLSLTAIGRRNGHGERKI
jgi:hypothetical protein